MSKKQELKKLTKEIQDLNWTLIVTKAKMKKLLKLKTLLENT